MNRVVLRILLPSVPVIEARVSKDKMAFLRVWSHMTDPMTFMVMVVSYGQAISGEPSVSKVGLNPENVLHRVYDVAIETKQE